MQGHRLVRLKNILMGRGEDSGSVEMVPPAVAAVASMGTVSTPPGGGSRGGGGGERFAPRADVCDQCRRSGWTLHPALCTLHTKP